MNYYNEHDPQKAAWLRELIRANVIAPGEVDERSITEIRAEDLRGFRQCHFFAGIGVWSYALRLAGWPDGREVAPVPALVQQEKAKGLMTLVTSGRNGFGSSASAALQRSLESRLMQRLDTAGSTLWEWTWKAKATPLRRRYFQRQASERRTKGIGCTSVPTPKMPKYGHDMAKFEREPGRKSPTDLETACYLAAVPTPMSGSPATESYNAAGNNDYSRKIVGLATVPTPTVADWNASRSNDAVAYSMRWMDRENHGSQLAHTVQGLCSVASPSARNWKDTSGMSETGVDPDGSIRTRLDQLPRQAQLADSGLTATGGTSATNAIGQLNAAYSRWLQGLPAVFDKSAVMAWRTLKTRRKRES